MIVAVIANLLVVLAAALALGFSREVGEVQRQFPARLLDQKRTR
ncbi:hypothetical protein [Streptomyces daqingensis]|nr:hypothetical protein [Streptomyces daqingensis]